MGWTTKLDQKRRPAVGIARKEKLWSLTALSVKTGCMLLKPELKLIRRLRFIRATFKLQLYVWMKIYLTKYRWTNWLTACHWKTWEVHDFSELINQTAWALIDGECDYKLLVSFSIDHGQYSKLDILIPLIAKCYIRLPSFVSNCQAEDSETEKPTLILSPPMTNLQTAFLESGRWN